MRDAADSSRFVVDWDGLTADLEATTKAQRIVRCAGPCELCDGFETLHWLGDPKSLLAAMERRARHAGVQLPTVRARPTIWQGIVGKAGEPCART